jgi:hypothetical protein
MQSEADKLKSRNLSKELAFVEAAFNKLNTYFFEGKLPTPILTIQSSIRAYGHCTTYHAWKDDRAAYYEINLGAETLNRELIHTLATLVHEMVHLYNMENEIKDTSRGNTYHNKHFKEEAEKRGLVITHHKTYGWTLTKPAEELIKFCELNYGDMSKISLHRVSFRESFTGDDSDKPKGTGSEDDQSEGPKNHSRKYQCPTCGCSVRATKEVRIKCMDCDEEMTEAS